MLFQILDSKMLNPDPNYRIVPDPCLDEYILPNSTQFIHALGEFSVILRNKGAPYPPSFPPSLPTSTFWLEGVDFF